MNAPAPFRLTAHARDVMRRRGVYPHDVADVLHGAAVVEHTEKGRRYTRGALTVVAVPERGALTVVTVLLHEQAQWTDEDARRRARAP